MTRLISMTALIVLCCGLNLAQSVSSSAPINWQRYRVSEKHISVLLPKMPVRFDWADICNETDISEYWVYADDTVFELRIVSKSSTKIPKECTEKNRFGQTNFDKRVKELDGRSGKSPILDHSFSTRPVFEAATKTSNRWIFDDLKNNEWVELFIVRRNGLSREEANFVSSLLFDNVPEGIEIADGSAITLGDENVVAPETMRPKLTDSPKSESNEDMVLISKKRSSGYTDEARTERIQGTVSLRVAFLGNGSIGTIEILKALPFGMTERTIDMVRKFVFLPAKANGRNVTVTKQFDYSFTIY